jgi:hypothetical protein
MGRHLRLVQPTTKVPKVVLVVRSAPVTWQLAWTEALRIADGDTLRLTRCTDGSVIVHNHPRRRPT